MGSILAGTREQLRALRLLLVYGQELPAEQPPPTPPPPPLGPPPTRPPRKDKKRPAVLNRSARRGRRR